MRLEVDGRVLVRHDRVAQSGRDQLGQAVTQCPAAALRLLD